MSEDSFESSTNGDIRCPTCGALQEGSDTCRRCRCDLTLLRRVTETAQASRRRCLLALRVGRHSQALRHARRFYLLCPDQSAARLLAVCYLLQGDWLSAVTLARIVDD
jgi:hypothetical protein